MEPPSYILLSSILDRAGVAGTPRTRSPPVRKKLFFVTLFIRGVNSPLGNAELGRVRLSYLADLRPWLARGVRSETLRCRFREPDVSFNISLSLVGDTKEFSTESNAERLCRVALRWPWLIYVAFPSTSVRGVSM